MGWAHGVIPDSRIDATEGLEPRGDNLLRHVVHMCIIMASTHWTSMVR